MTTRIRASALILKNNQVLLIHRHRDNEEYWVFPGGGVETNEEYLEAAKREMFEETSLNISRIIDQKTYPDPENHHARHFFVVCEPTEGKPHAQKEEQDASRNNSYEPKWLNISEALALHNLYPIPVKNYLRDINHDAHQS